MKLTTATLLVLAGLLIATARATEPTETLTLACQGTQTRYAAAGMTSEQITMTLTLDFQKGTIVGFPGSNAPVNISNSDDVMVSFSRDGGNSRFNGIIDKKRKTVDAVNMSLDTNTPDFGYTMKCKSSSSAPHHELPAPLPAPSFPHAYPYRGVRAGSTPPRSIGVTGAGNSHWVEYPDPPDGQPRRAGAATGTARDAMPTADQR